MANQVEEFVNRLAVESRLVILGGLAVIAHGLSRHTQDVDVWLDPMRSAGEWARVLWNTGLEFPGVTFHRLPGWIQIGRDELGTVAAEIGMVRVGGLSRPLDIFRRPNEFSESDFETVVARAKRNADGTLLPHPVDLIQTKIDTGRDKDRMDIFHLESLIRAEYRERLPMAEAGEAREMLQRYSDWEVLSVAMNHSAPEVRELALEHLREFAAEGDPFSQAILAGRPVPGG